MMISRQQWQALTSLVIMALLMGFIAVLLTSGEDQAGVKHVLILPFWHILLSELLSGVQRG